MAKLKDQAGNESCYFYIGMLFYIDFGRATSVGTIVDRDQAFDIRYEPRPGTSLRGYPEIMEYFLKEYIRRDPHGPHVNEATTILARLSTPSK